MKAPMIIAVIVVPLGLLCGTASGAPDISTNVVAFNNPVCPVEAGDVEGTNCVTHDGVQYSVCCAACADEFKKDPDKYIATLPNKGKIVDLNNARCPVTGSPVSAKNHVVYNGTNVLFYCPPCYTSIKECGAYIKTALKSSPRGGAAKAQGTDKTPVALAAASGKEMP